MKITRRQLRQIIKEEYVKAIRESLLDDPDAVDISLIFVGTDTAGTITQSAVAIAESRKDCVVFSSAPAFLHASNFSGFVSTAITFACAQWANMSMWIPSPPPAPNTTTVSVGMIRALFITLTGVAIASVITPTSAGKFL